MRNLFFKEPEDMDVEELEKANKILTKLLKILCLLGYHDVVEVDLDEFVCFNCENYRISQTKVKKDNFITKLIRHRADWIAHELYYCTNSYRDY